MGNINFVLYMVQALIHLLVCAYFAIKCFRPIIRCKRLKVAIICVAYVVVSIVIIELFLERTAPYPQYKGIVGLIWIVISIFAVRLLVRTNALLISFFVFSLNNIMLKTMYVSKTIYALKIFPEGEITYIIISLCVLVLMLPFMYYLYVILFKKVVQFKLSELYLKWLFAIPVTYFVFYYQIGSVFAELIKMYPWGCLIAVLLSNIANYLAYVAALQMFLKMNESLKATEKANLTQQIILMNKEQSAQLSEGIEATARLQHDFRHHLIAFEGLLENKNYTGLSNYIKQYKKDFPVTDIAPVCNNYMVNIILKHYISRARASGIVVKVAVNIPNNFQIPDTDLCVVFGNLFENALEACEKQKSGDKFITIKSRNVNRNLHAISIKNSYDGELIVKGEGFLSSKKVNGGIGISTVQYIAKACGGSCEFKYSDGVFCANVLLFC